MPQGHYHCTHKCKAFEYGTLVFDQDDTTYLVIRQGENASIYPLMGEAIHKQDAQGYFVFFRSGLSYRKIYLLTPAEADPGIVQG